MCGFISPFLLKFELRLVSIFLDIYRVGWPSFTTLVRRCWNCSRKLLYGQAHNKWIMLSSNCPYHLQEIFPYHLHVMSEMCFTWRLLTQIIVKSSMRIHVSWESTSSFWHILALIVHQENANASLWLWHVDTNI